MKVLVVCNNAFSKGNGLHTVMQSLIPRLKDAGLEVRLLAAANEDPHGPQPEYPLEHFRFPVFDSLITAHSYGFAKADRKIIEAAINGMLSSLDPHSSFLDADSFRDMQIQTKKTSSTPSYFGIREQSTVDNESFVII